MVNIRIMSKSMHKIVEASGFLTVLQILEGIKNSLMQVEFSQWKNQLFPSVWLPLKIGEIFGSVRKLCLKMASKHKFALFPPLFRPPTGSQLGPPLAGITCGGPPSHQIR